MVKLATLTESVIQKKGFGIWPKSFGENQNDDALIKTLDIEYRLQEYLVSSKLDGLVPLQNADHQLEHFNSQFDSLLSSTLTPLAKFVTSINAGHVKLLQNQLKESTDVLESAVLDFGENANNYTQSLFYRKHYLLAIASHYLKDTKHEEQWLSTGVNYFSKIPTLSNIESTKWLHLIYDRILLSFSNTELSQLNSIFKYKNFILSFINHAYSRGVKFNANEVGAFVQARSTKLLSSTEFPRSDENNNYELEEFLSLANDSSLIEPKVSAGFIEAGINKTYQSHILLRALTSNLLHLGKREESLHSFEVYREYIESYYVQNNHSFNDIMGILNTFNIVLESRFIKTNDVKITEKEYVDYIKILNQFKDLITTFYKDNDITQVDEEFDLLDQNLTNVNNNELRDLLSKFWFTLAVSNIKLYQSPYSISTENEPKLLESIKFFKNSIYNKSNDDCVYQYVKFIASLRRIREAYRVLRQFLTKQTEKNVTFFKSWHLLALIVSIEENKDESYKIINFLLAEINEYIEVHQQNVSYVLKESFIQVKITQLAIIESLLGIEQSLDSLPELFTLYNQLFETTKEEQDEAISNKSAQPELKRVSTLTKIKSIRSSHKDTPKPTTIANRPSVKSKTSKDQLLQKIWLLSASIYYKANLLEDSEQAIVEAEKIYRPTSETHATLGLITSEARPAFALKEFEIALDIERDYPLAIIGISKLLLSDDQRVYINDKDMNAGLARVKILLELLAENFHNSYLSEVWFLLSKIYEKYGDQQRLRKSLWKSIELEETRPIRDFINV